MNRYVLDNLKAAVEKADWYDPELNPKLRSFADHYGLAVLPTKPRTPRHKGKIESGVDYVKSNALKGHSFSSLEEENQHLLTWETTVADLRIHGTIRQQVGKLFADVERAALQPLPVERFPFFHEGQRAVHRDGHVEVEKAYYSVPPEYLGFRVGAVGIAGSCGSSTSICSRLPCMSRRNRAASARNETTWPRRRSARWRAAPSGC